MEQVGLLDDALKVQRGLFFTIEIMPAVKKGETGCGEACTEIKAADEFAVVAQ